jgi:hypothetical protein
MNSNKHFHIALSAIEFYGKLYPIPEKEDLILEEKKFDELGIRQPIVDQGCQVQMFLYQSEFDYNGIFYYLGTCMGAMDWINPCNNVIGYLAI